MAGYSFYVLGSVLFATTLLLLIADNVEASCRKCCKGKDNGCRAFGPRTSRPNATTCFCDESCNILGDCCLDYSKTCKARDCVVEKDWGYWAECSESCGWGHKTRSKNILQQAENGGMKCGQTEQKTYCLGIKCKGRRQTNGLQEVGETGKIIPAQFGAWRKNKLYDPYNDIRKNLFHHYGKDKIIKRPSYCAKFEIIETRKACQAPLSGNWAKGLKKGHTLCVECQPSAMKKDLGVRCKGHGVYLRETRWNAVTVPGCHGRWIMTSQREDCSCSAKDNNSFILI